MATTRKTRVHKVTDLRTAYHQICVTPKRTAIYSVPRLITRVGNRKIINFQDNSPLYSLVDLSLRRSFRKQPLTLFHLSLLEILRCCAN